MNRRGFFSRFFGLGAAAVVVDPERLLWRPEEKTIFIPPAPVIADPLLDNPLLGKFDAETLEAIRRSLYYRSFFQNNEKYLALRQRGFPIPVAIEKTLIDIPEIQS